MTHIAIMKKSWQFIPKILAGEKTIESRFYMAKFAPWGRIGQGDIIYFKNSGEPVTAKAEVDKVLQFDNLDKEKIVALVKKYSKDLGIENADFNKFIELKKNKKYAILMFIKNPEAVEPFNIDKNGFGNAAAWLSVEKISDIRHKV